MDTTTSSRFSSLFSAVVLVLGAIIAAAVLGAQFRIIGAGRQTISVKGLAERQVRADQAEWAISVRFNGSHGIVVTMKDLELVGSARKAAVQFKADGHPVEYGDPQYLVSSLEQVKMSLIGAATRDARARAEEFAKNGGVKAGSMRSASQGAFNILAPGAGADASEYGGTYDKTTIDKVARVVVTIEYAIEP